MKALKRISCFPNFIWLAIRCRTAFSFLVIVLQILFICSSSFSSESKDILSEFLLRFVAINKLSKRITLDVFQLKISSFPELALTWSFLHLRNYRWYIFCTGIGNSAIRVAGNVSILTFNQQVNEINIKQQRSKHQNLWSTILSLYHFFYYNYYLS